MNNEFKQHQQNGRRKNFKIYKTILQIMQSRGYGVDDDHKNMSFQQYSQNQHQYNRQTQIFYMVQDDQQQQQQSQMRQQSSPESILVYFNPHKYDANPQAISDAKVKNLIAASTDVKKFIIVGGTDNKGKQPTINIDKKAASFIDSVGKEKQVEIQLFRDEDLMFNVLKHDLVPEHKVLSKKQKEQLLKKYKVKESQLPKILLTDPVARFLGLKRGQVVKINRKSQTAGTYTTYRIAI